MKKSITRRDIVSNIANKMNISRQLVISVLKSTLVEIQKSLFKEHRVKISSFGTFHVQKKKQRVGRNPRTKISAIISARQVVSFIPSSQLRKAVLDYSTQNKRLNTED
ncbi:HU family DNA-binding protein [Candidatus Paracaedibacter symbiosus]|uniref:HU family DNA-binding protein n=1 Tax=Candidatus Paracaedibacter symbiosus TaxID=244582 RepID=UPI000509EE07|nr:HU family DNA-binding protein [Candidatus Paracaedibacter symbiosus]